MWKVIRFLYCNLQAKALLALHVYGRQTSIQAQQQCVSQHSLFYTRQLLSISMVRDQSSTGPRHESNVCSLWVRDQSSTGPCHESNVCSCECGTNLLLGHVTNQTCVPVSVGPIFYWAMSRIKRVFMCGTNLLLGHVTNQTCVHVRAGPIFYWAMSRIKRVFLWVWDQSSAGPCHESNVCSCECGTNLLLGHVTNQTCVPVSAGPIFCWACHESNVCSCAGPIFCWAMSRIKCVFLWVRDQSSTGPCHESNVCSCECGTNLLLGHVTNETCVPVSVGPIFWWAMSRIKRVFLWVWDQSSGGPCHESNVCSCECGTNLLVGHVTNQTCVPVSAGPIFCWAMSRIKRVFLWVRDQSSAGPCHEWNMCSCECGTNLLLGHVTNQMCVPVSAGPIFYWAMSRIKRVFLWVRDQSSAGPCHESNVCSCECGTNLLLGHVTNQTCVPVSAGPIFCWAMSRIKCVFLWVRDQSSAGPCHESNVCSCECGDQSSTGPCHESNVCSCECGTNLLLGHVTNQTCVPVRDQSSTGPHHESNVCSCAGPIFYWAMSRIKHVFMCGTNLLLGHVTNQTCVLVSVAPMCWCLLCQQPSTVNAGL